MAGEPARGGVVRPSTTAPDLGRKCYREDHEPSDGRPALKREQFWADGAEQEVYEAVAHENPRLVDLEVGTIESPLAYIQRLAEIAAKNPLVKPGRRFPPRRRLAQEYTGPREPITEGNLTFEDRTDATYERSPGEEG